MPLVSFVSTVRDRRQLVRHFCGLGVLGGMLALVQPASLLHAYQARPVAVRSQLVWLDRAGRRSGVLGILADYGNVELSPDGQRLAVAVMDSTRGAREIWMYDVASGRHTKFTSDLADENWLIWSRDGSRVVFNSQRNRGLDLYQASSSGTGGDEALLIDRDPKWPVSWSPDGRFILYVINSQRTGNDVLVLPLFGDRKPFPFLQTAAVENWAAFSLDRSVGCSTSSDESGEAEVYVAQFPPAPGRKVRISSGGGSQARWRRDGKELFYLAPGRVLMSAAVGRLRVRFQRRARRSRCSRCVMPTASITRSMSPRTASGSSSTPPSRSAELGGFPSVTAH